MSSPTLSQIILTCSPDGHITAYTTTSAAVTRFSGSRSPRNGLTFLGENHFAASHVSSGAGEIHLYDWCTTTPFHLISAPEHVAPLAATRDGRYLFAGGISGNIHIFSLPSGDLIRSFPAHSKPISCFGLNIDGSVLLSGSDDGTVAVFPIYKLLDPSSCRSTTTSDVIWHRLIGHESSVTAITTGIGGINSTVISCSLDCCCKLWSLMHGTHLKTVTFPCAIWGIAMDTMESEFYAAGSDGSVYTGRLKAPEQDLATWQQKHDGPIIAISTINYGKHLVTASENGGVWIWELDTREVVKVLSERMGSVSGLVVVAKEFCEGSGNSKFSEWNLGSYVEEMSWPMREMIEIETTLNGVVEDRSRAVSHLESAMGIYEKLLELILKELMAVNNNDDDDDDDDHDDI